MADRCRSCGHPLAEGEWTRCDDGCEHGGYSFASKRGGFSTGNTREDIPFNAAHYLRLGYSVKARGRARAEERDCPECDGRGTILDPVGAIWSIQAAGNMVCAACSGSGRVRPLRCQACEREEHYEF